MFDTIILTIPKGYIITDHSRFTPSTKGMRASKQFYCKYVNNPTKEDWERGIYKPRLTIFKGGKAFCLKIEFSAPKLLFNNNLDELCEQDFDQVVSVLKQRIEEMGVKLFDSLIENAEVSSFHPAKNIPLSRGYTSIFAIRELNKIDVSKKFDITRVKYRNGGEELQIYSNSHSLVFYDKINDLSKPAKRAVDKDQTPQQFSLFDDIKNRERRMEVLRMEVRLSKKRKMNEILKKLGYPKNPTFKQIFNEELCQKILLYYWDYFFKDNLPLFTVQNNPQKILQFILSQSPQISIKKAIYLTGAVLLGKDEEGMRGFRNITEIYKPKTNWTQLKKWLEYFQNQIANTPLHGFIKDIEQQLRDFKPYKLPEKPK